MTTRIDDRTREELEAIAQTGDISVSQLVRGQLDVLLGRDVAMVREDAPHTLSLQQRLILAQQHEILAHLNAEDEDAVEFHTNIVKVIREGYTGEYGDVFAGLDPELSRSECSLLWDVLDMFTVLAASVDYLSPEERDELGDDERHLRFLGFDLNDPLEARLLSYTRYLLRAGRWPDIQKQFDELRDRGNSHHRNLPVYQRMLETQREIMATRAERGRYSAAGQRLSFEELRRIAAEWVHPSHRP